MRIGDQPSWEMPRGYRIARTQATGAKPWRKPYVMPVCGVWPCAPHARTVILDAAALCLNSRVQLYRVRL